MTWLRGILLAIVGNWKAMLAAIGVAILTAGVALIRKSGEDAQKARQAKIDEAAAKVITKERKEAEGLTDAELNKEVDRWSR
jgi:hypothetical protein